MRRDVVARCIKWRFLAGLSHNPTRLLGDHQTLLRQVYRRRDGAMSVLILQREREHPTHQQPPAPTATHKPLLGFGAIYYCSSHRVIRRTPQGYLVSIKQSVSHLARWLLCVQIRDRSSLLSSPGAAPLSSSSSTRSSRPWCKTWNARPVNSGLCLLTTTFLPVKVMRRRERSSSNSSNHQAMRKGTLTWRRLCEK